MRTTSPAPTAGPSPRRSPSSNSGGSGSWTIPNHSCGKMAAKFEGKTHSWWTTRKSYTRSWWRKCRKMSGWYSCETNQKKRRRKTWKAWWSRWWANSKNKWKSRESRLRKQTDKTWDWCWTRPENLSRRSSFKEIKKEKSNINKTRNFRKTSSGLPSKL